MVMTYAKAITNVSNANETIVKLGIHSQNVFKFLEVFCSYVLSSSGYTHEKVQ